MELKTYLAIIARRWWIILIALIGAIFAAYYVSQIIPPVYEATATFLVTTPMGGTISNVQYADNYANRLLNTYAQIASSDSVMAELKQKLQLEKLPDIEVAIVPNSEIIQIKARANSSFMVAKIANTLAEIVVSKSLTTIDSGEESSQDLSILSDRLSTFEKELTQAKLDYDQMIEPYSQVTADITVLDRTIKLKEQTYQNLQEKFQQAVISESEAIYPSQKNQFKNTQNIISAEISQLETEMETLNQQYQGLSARAANISERLSSAKQAIDTKEKAYTDLLLQYDLARSGNVMRSSSHSLLISNPAVLPTRPSNLSSTIFIGLGGVIGLLLGLTLAFLVDNLDTKIYSPEQIENITKNPILAQIPYLKGQQMLSHVRSDIEIQRAYWPLCARILLRQKEAPLKTILLTSPDAGEGKSTTTFLLAACLSQSKLKVLVVDGDMRLPKQHKLFKLPNDTGLSSVLMGEALLERAINKNKMPGVDVLTSGPTPDNLVDLLHPSILIPILEKMAASYDIVLIDSPCLLAVTDANSLAQIVDGVILILKHGYTTTGALRSANRLLNDANAKIIGTVFTFAPVQKRSSYYRYYGSRSSGIKGVIRRLISGGSKSREGTKTTR